MIDLRSDTVTKPSQAMRDAARDAEVGDDVYGDDPSVNELERRAADLVGKEKALFVPSGTMGNQVAIRTHTERGQELVVDEQAHVVKWEVGGVADLSGVQARMVDCGPRAVPTAAQVEAAHVEESLHRPGTGLLCVENTHNSRGGVAVGVDEIAEACEAAHDLGVPVHLDGARVFNASVALGVAPEELTGPADTVNFCLSKGLGAPVGSILAGPEGFVERARRVRKLFGGGMRQAGIVAAPGLLALENVDRLAEDHANARTLAAGLDDIAGLSTREPDTNIVMLSVEADVHADDLVAACEEHGVAFGARDASSARLCTHLDVSRAEVREAVDRVAAAVGSLRA
ncbi:low specificity L-threonine aldolase [Salinigranum rubrum]|uniref:Low specificity L-threonine aldolase n=1 Tax=Salinigranum rubrum TaxID=755307 RepID=A0A2I8VNB9_9EURY|nr:GntG family PLP-dependent aldolase [Salinigranum rubrum]AUV83430.1 low specificity L-threonine aldolase [Salinigranum rubrum]